ncbi:MAG: hypothetical protein QW630_04555 [Sulfolobales archaeon]
MLFVLFLWCWVGSGAILLVLALDVLGEVPRSKKLDPGEIAVMPVATPS